MLPISPTRFTKIISTPLLARHLRCSQAWLNAEAAAGRIPAVRAGKRNFIFNIKAVEQVLAQRATEGEIEL